MDDFASLDTPGSPGGCLNSGVAQELAKSVTVALWWDIRVYLIIFRLFLFAKIQYNPNSTTEGESQEFATNRFKGHLLSILGLMNVYWAPDT